MAAFHYLGPKKKTFLVEGTQIFLHSDYVSIVNVSKKGTQKLEFDNSSQKDSCNYFHSICVTIISYLMHLP